jgi:hypothetical protein
MDTLRFRQIHLDFHTSELIRGVGSKFDPEDFARTLKAAHVNSITCFARCHHGYIYYKTRRFPQFMHPHLSCDLLQDQIEACHAQGIRVPIYVTVGWDHLQARLNPGWVSVRPDGTLGGHPLQPTWRLMCFNSPFIDYVIAQATDVLQVFKKDVDGFFFDIIFHNCVCPRCVKSMQELGLDPLDAADRDAFSRKVVSDFKRRCTAAVRKLNKDCTIFYNAGHVDPSIRADIKTYTHLELESLPSGGWGYDHFPLTVRFARLLGKEYMGMTGKFHRSWADFGGFKNPASLQYEVFTMLAEGAKCSIGDQLAPLGSIDKSTYKLIGPVYASVEEKEPWCRDVTPITDIGVLYSAGVPQAAKAAERTADGDTGALHMLLEGHYQFDCIDAEVDFAKYKVIILPDVIPVDAALAKKLDAYAKAGGKLLLSYKSGLTPDGDRFALKGMPVEYIGDAPFEPDYVTARKPIAEGFHASPQAMYKRGVEVRPVRGAQVLADVWHPYFQRRFDHFCSHAQTPVEKKTKLPAAAIKGNIAYLAHPVFQTYRVEGARVCKVLALNTLDLLLDAPAVATDAPTTAHITLMRQSKPKRKVLHILHYIPERRSTKIDIVEDVIPLRDVVVSVRCGARPRRVYLAPSGETVRFEMFGEYAMLLVPEVVGHQMVVIE